MLYVLLPAAGRSSRMRGRDKLVEDISGVPLLRAQALKALEVSGQVIVALPGPKHPFRIEREAALSGLSVHILYDPDSRFGLGGTIGAVARALPADATHLMTILPDLVKLTVEDLRTMVQDLDDRPRRAAAQDHTPGHPVIFPRRLFAALASADPASDAPREILKSERTTFIRLPADNATHDLDTPEAWAAWRGTALR